MSINPSVSSYGQKFVCLDNRGQEIWHKVRKYSKIRQDFKNLIFNFAYFLTVNVKV